MEHGPSLGQKNHSHWGLEVLRTGTREGERNDGSLGRFMDGTVRVEGDGGGAGDR